MPPSPKTLDKLEKSMVLFCDGASRGNPGPASYGFVLIENGEVVVQEGRKIGQHTNNVAEYQGLIQGVKKALSMGVTELTVKCDSELMVRQLNGQYKVKAAHLIPLFKEAREALGRFKKVVVQHVRREENSLADALANQALDSF